MHCTPVGSDSSAGFVWGVYLDDDTQAHTDSNNLCEQGLTSYTVQNGGTGVPSTVVSKGYKRTSFLNRNTDSTYGSASSNPSEIAAFCLFIQGLGNSTDIGAAKFHVTIDYVVKFIERTTLASS